MSAPISSPRSIASARDVDHDLYTGAKVGELRLTIDLRKRGLLQSRRDRRERVV